ncbi:MAG: DUF4249 domain-containing protein [Balneolaceae bacterium]
MRNSFLTISLAVLTLLGCETYSQSDYEEFYVVESYIVANRNLQQVRVSTTVPAFEFYDFEESAIRDALVEVRLLSETGAVIEQTFSYSMSEPGIYQPDIAHSVLPTRSYELYVTIPNGSLIDEITATAIVPDTFSVIGGVLDTLVYQSSEQLEVTLSESSYPGRQNVFVFTTISENPTVENLTPLYLDFYDDEEDLQEFTITSSGLLNEGNFTQFPDGSVTVQYPWLAVAFYEENRIVATTVDDNIYDYIRSNDVQLGGSTLSPGEIQNVLTNVKGGIGLFGAMASDTIPTFIERNPNF